MLPSTARSLAEAFTLRATATTLLLPASPDLRCMNLMCERAGQGCACRLSLSLERMPLLSHLDVSDNSLPQLPDALFMLPRLRELRAPRNALSSLPAALAGAALLEVLDLRWNAFATLPVAALEALPALRELNVEGNPLEEGARAALLASSLCARGAVRLE